MVEGTETLNMNLESVENPGKFFTALSRDLKSVAFSNIKYFQDGKHSHHAKFHVTFSLLYEYLDLGIEPSYGELSKFVYQYDFSPEVKGNGYRSLLTVVQKCCLHLLQLCRYISSVRDSVLFRKKFYARELESYVSALGQLRAVLYYALKLVSYCQDGELFVDEGKLNNEIAEQLVLDVETLSQESFYGRCLGFQFCQSMQRPMQILAIAMASYSEGYLESSQMMQVATSVFNSGKYILDPELRAQQIVKVTRTADIKFCKAFWGFSESSLMHQLPSFVCPSVEVNEVITLGPNAFELPLINSSDTVVVTPPCAHTGPGHVHTRLISAHLRDGQQTLQRLSKMNSSPCKPRTSGLIVHIHGGGFVAQSSKSHEVYLRDWAVSVGVPILSVDYSLAPEHPFPRALEECFYAYAWAVQNSAQLGSTGEKIIIVGDSAGANLAISTAMRAASFGIRPPDGILAVYPCTVVRYTPSPARLLSLMDPVLPFGLITRCLAAYAGISEKQPMPSASGLDDVHSEKSLTSIQIRSYETADSEWIIISQEKDEPDASSSSSHQMTGRKSQTLAKKRRTSKLSAGEKEQNSKRDLIQADIFSLLESDGGCAFPCGVRDVSAGTVDKEECDQVIIKLEDNANVNQNEESSRSKMAYSNLTKFQEGAWMMVEGAQNMFTKVSSYIPAARDMSAQDLVSSLTSFLPSGSASLHSERPKFFSDADKSSDPVDDICPQDSSSIGGNLKVSGSSRGCTLDIVDISVDHVKKKYATCSFSANQEFEETDYAGPEKYVLPGQNMYGLDLKHCTFLSDHVSLIGSSEDSNLPAYDNKMMDSPIDEISIDSDFTRTRSSSFEDQDFDTAHTSPVSHSEHQVSGSSSQDFDTAHTSPVSHSEHQVSGSSSRDFDTVHTSPVLPAEHQVSGSASRDFHTAHTSPVSHSEHKVSGSASLDNLESVAGSGSLSVQHECHLCGDGADITGKIVPAVSSDIHYAEVSACVGSEFASQLKFSVTEKPELDKLPCESDVPCNNNQELHERSKSSFTGQINDHPVQSKELLDVKDGTEMSVDLHVLSADRFTQDDQTAGSLLPDLPEKKRLHQESALETSDFLPALSLEHLDVLKQHIFSQGDLFNNRVSQDDLLDSMVSQNDLMDGKVNPIYLMEGKVNQSDLMDGKVNQSDLMDEVSQSGLMDGKVSQSDLMDGKVSQIEMEDSRFNPGDLEDNMVNQGDLVDSKVSQNDFLDSHGYLLDSKVSQINLEDKRISKDDLVNSRISQGDLVNSKFSNNDFVVGGNILNNTEADTGHIGQRINCDCHFHHLVNDQGHNHLVNDQGHNHLVNDQGHNHLVNDQGHNHLVNDQGHNHLVNDQGHNHLVNDQGHNHLVNDQGHNHLVNDQGHKMIDEGHMKQIFMNEEPINHNLKDYGHEVNSGHHEVTIDNSAHMVFHKSQTGQTRPSIPPDSLNFNTEIMPHLKNMSRSAPNSPAKMADINKLKSDCHELSSQDIVASDKNVLCNDFQLKPVHLIRSSSDKEFSSSLPPSPVKSRSDWFLSHGSMPVLTALVSPNTPVTQSETTSPSRTVTQSETTSPSRTVTQSETTSPSRTVTQSETISPSRTVAQSETTSPSRTVTQSETTSPSRTVTQSETTSPSRTVTQSETTSPSRTVTQSETTSPSRTVAQSETTSPSRTVAQSETTSPSRTVAQSETTSPSRTVAQSETTSPSRTVAQSETTSPSRTVAQSETTSPSRTVTQSETTSPSRTVTQSETTSPSRTVTQSETTFPSRTVTQSETTPPNVTSHDGVRTGAMSPTDFEKQSFATHSPLHTLRRAAAVNNPYMSPLLASQELLRGLPAVSIVACHLDPLLDDSVMFARRLRSLQVPVNLHLVDDLPHGFLNFALLSFEAKQAADLCARKISEMLQCSSV